MNVLLVDDEATILKMMKAILQRRGFQVYEATNAAAAKGLAQLHPIDLLVTDVVMEHTDGTTLARSLAERQPGLLVLFVSGYPLDLEAERRHHGRCGFLCKPFQPGELISALADLGAMPAG